MARILTCYYKPKPGGLCTRLFRSIRALLERGHEVHYLAVERYPIDHRSCYFHRFPWPAERAQGFAFWAVFHATAPVMLLYLGLRYRITHSYAFATTYAFVLQPLRALTHIPLALFLRADVIENHRLLERPAALLRLELLIEGIAILGTYTYGVSRTLTRAVAQRHRRLRAHVTGTLTNEVVLSKAQRVFSYHKGHPLRFACVGVLEPRKNIEFALRAFAATSSDKASLVLYGDGPSTPGLKELTVALNLNGRAHFAGWLPRDAIWSEVDVLLFPSLHEGFPNAVCEAINSYVPVVASDTAEHRELLPTGSLYALNLQTWQAVLQSLCSQPEQLNDLATQQQRFASHYSFDWDQAIVERILLSRSIS